MSRSMIRANEPRLTPKQIHDIPMKVLAIAATRTAQTSSLGHTRTAGNRAWPRTPYFTQTVFTFTNARIPSRPSSRP
jgi:hypothetical protein